MIYARQAGGPIGHKHWNQEWIRPSRPTFGYSQNPFF
jgi:hypothetical protein